MRYVAAYLLLVLGGKSSPTASDIEKLLGSVEVNVDHAKAKFVIDQMKGKSVDAVMAIGAAKLGALPAGGGKAGPASSGKGAKPAGETAEAKTEPKEEEKKEDSEPDSDDDDMGFGLFGDDDD